ncbi:TRAP transporter substrate-binding protein DctP [Polaromonas sp. P1(28)-8]|nr:TRAP transporter substrate-binding protein DctP [Polaromonas sp. P1(28)-8]
MRRHRRRSGRQEAARQAGRKGLVGLAYWELGYRQMTNSKRPLNKVEDIDGLKLRVIPNPINVDWVKALGANPTPMPFPEVYGGLEQKAIDGQENPVAVIAANKFWEVQKHIALTNHQYNPQSVIFSKKIWDTLSAAEKKILDDAADDAAKFQREQSRCGGRQPGAAQEERHDRHPVLAGRSGQAAREDEAGDCQVQRQRRRGDRQRNDGRTGQAAQIRRSIATQLPRGH